jgi:hypothetical protein
VCTFLYISAAIQSIEALQVDKQAGSVLHLVALGTYNTYACMYVCKYACVCVCVCVCMLQLVALENGQIILCSLSRARVRSPSLSLTHTGNGQIILYKDKAVMSIITCNEVLSAYATYIYICPHTAIYADTYMCKSSYY